MTAGCPYSPGTWSTPLCRAPYVHGHGACDRGHPPTACPARAGTGLRPPLPAGRGSWCRGRVSTEEAGVVCEKVGERRQVDWLHWVLGGRGGRLQVTSGSWVTTAAKLSLSKQRLGEG